MLHFHVIVAKLQCILGYSGLKRLRLRVDFGEDCLTSPDGKKLMCHAVQVKEEEKGVKYRGLHVWVTHTKDAK